MLKSMFQQAAIITSINHPEVLHWMILFPLCDQFQHVKFSLMFFFTYSLPILIWRYVSSKFDSDLKGFIWSMWNENVRLQLSIQIFLYLLSEQRNRQHGFTWLVFHKYSTIIGLKRLNWQFLIWVVFNLLVNLSKWMIVYIY